jgi:hypothetical protein
MEPSGRNSWQSAASGADPKPAQNVRALLPLLHVPTLVLARKDVVAPKGGVGVRSPEEAEYVAGGSRAQSS